jgi:hypothetical protein
MSMACLQASEGCYRCGADNAAKILPHHDGKDCPAAKKGSPEAGVYHEFPDFISDINNLRWPVGACVIEQDINPSPCIHSLIDGFLNILPVGNVTHHGEGVDAKITLDLISNGAAAFKVHIGYDNARTFPGKHAGSSLSYACTGCSGAKCYSIFQLHRITSGNILPESGDEKQGEKIQLAIGYGQ